MKNIFTIASILVLGLLINFSCKKSTATSNTTTAGSTTTVNTNTTTTNLSVDGNTVAGMGATGNVNGASQYQLYGSAVGGYPNVNITFSNTTPSGNYTISTSTYPPAGHCYFNYFSSVSVSSAASSGVVTVVAGSPNTAIFTNIVCNGNAGTHTLTGAFKF
ncbi:MAG TPA: hypothetical protein VK835_01955 [Bacteroidia bacterium]|jgi:hypothetical protein|nr:hypothetical protein [Bacteroidia bacterium]